MTSGGRLNGWYKYNSWSWGVGVGDDSVRRRTTSKVGPQKTSATNNYMIARAGPLTHLGAALGGPLKGGAGDRCNRK